MNAFRVRERMRRRQLKWGGGGEQSDADAKTLRELWRRFSQGGD